MNKAQIDRSKVNSELERKCIINPNSKWKLRWDMYIMIMMILASIFTPWQLAFVEDETV